MNKKYTFIDLFAGCGGLSLGLEQAGFHPVYVNELNKDAMATYLDNRKEYPLLHDKRFHSYDIHELTKKKKLEALTKNLKKELNLKKRDISLVVGGPPCQGYSGIGHRRSYKIDKKDIESNYLYKEMVKVIKYIEPKAFIFENVKGLISGRWSKKGKKGEIFNDVLKEFKTLKNYFQDFVLIQSKNYGVPQNRPRIFLIGIRKDQKFSENLFMTANGMFPEPEINAYPNLIDLLGDLIDKNYEKNFITNVYTSSPKNDLQKKLRMNKNNKNYFRKGEKITDHEYSKHSPRIVKKFEYMLSNEGKITNIMKTKKFSQRLTFPKWKKDGPNITATSLPDDYVHFSQPRSFTVREWARLQMFPDWYTFKGKRTTGGLRRAGNNKDVTERELPKYTQIGNAVPVELARRIGLHIKKFLKN